MVTSQFVQKPKMLVPTVLLFFFMKVAAVTGQDCTAFGECKYCTSDFCTVCELGYKVNTAGACEFCGPCSSLSSVSFPFECSGCSGCEWSHRTNSCFDCNEAFGSDSHVCESCREDQCNCSWELGVDEDGTCKECDHGVSDERKGALGRSVYVCDDMNLYNPDTTKQQCCELDCPSIQDEQECKNDDSGRCRWVNNGPLGGKCYRKCSTESDNSEVPVGCRNSWCIALNEVGDFSCEKCKSFYTLDREDNTDYGRCVLDSCEQFTTKDSCKQESTCRWVPPNNGGPLAGTCAAKCQAAGVDIPEGCKTSWCVVQGSDSSCERCKNGNNPIRPQPPGYGRCE